MVKKHGALILAALILIPFGFTFKARAQWNPKFTLDQLIANLKKSGPGTSELGVIVHSPQMVHRIRAKYHRADIQKLLIFLKSTLTLKTDSHGLVKASDRLGEKADPTHYDAVWVRDSLWAYLALKEKNADPVAAKRLLLSLLDYFSSPDQVQRFQAVIKNPDLIHGPDGQMAVPHIRFDGNSPDFKDVFENGHPQRWNHKQNDALGLFLDLFCRAVLDGSLDQKTVTPARGKVIGLFPAYFSATHYYEMEDAGAWEEIERTNTSSMALVTSGLERLLDVIGSRSPRPGARRYRSPTIQAVASRLGSLDAVQINGIVNKGYDRIFKQLAASGESPLYDPQEPHYRQADAALLNLIYPAQLQRLHQADYDEIIRILQPLVGDVGIKRYLKDSYQSGNFWFAPPPSSNPAKAKTDDTSSKSSFADRGKQFLDGTEAQWFFDSWYSNAMGILYQRYQDPRYLDLETKFLNRSLAQITGGTESQPLVGADGRPVKPLSLPESYNTVVDTATGEKFFVPSPITPLNWSRASLHLALDRILLSLKN